MTNKTFKWIVKKLPKHGDSSGMLYINVFPDCVCHREKVASIRFLECQCFIPLGYLIGFKENIEKTIVNQPKSTTSTRFSQVTESTQSVSDHLCQVLSLTTEGGPLLGFNMFCPKAGRRLGE